MQSLTELRKALDALRKEQVRPVSSMTADEIKAELEEHKAKHGDSDSEHDMPAALPRRAVSKDLTVGLMNKARLISPWEKDMISKSSLPEEYKKKLLDVQGIKTKKMLLGVFTPIVFSELDDVIKKLKHLNSEDARKVLQEYANEPTTHAPSIPRKPKSRSPSPTMETKAVTNPLSIKYAPRKK